MEMPWTRFFVIQTLICDILLVHYNNELFATTYNDKKYKLLKKLAKDSLGWMGGLPVAKKIEEFPTTQGRLASHCNLIYHFLCLTCPTFTIQLNELIAFFSLPQPCLSHVKRRTDVHFRDGIALHTELDIHTSHTIIAEYLRIPHFSSCDMPSRTEQQTSKVRQSQDSGGPDGDGVESTGSLHARSIRVLMLSATPCHLHPP